MSERTKHVSRGVAAFCNAAATLIYKKSKIKEERTLRKKIRNSVLLGLALVMMLGIALVVPTGPKGNSVQASSSPNASIFNFVATSNTECDVRLLDKTVTRAIVPDKATINGREYIVTSVAANGFASAPHLEKVRLPRTIKTIGMSAFMNCVKLESITLPAVQTINTNAFSFTNMNHLIIPRTTTSVGQTILRNCSTKVYVKGPRNQSGWNGNWNGNNSITAVDFDSNFVPSIQYRYIDNSVAPFGIMMFSNATSGYVVDDYQLFVTTSGVDVYIPAMYMGEPVIGIADFAFFGNDMATITIGYADTPIRIGYGAFWGYEGNTVTINREVLFEDDGGMEAECVFYGSLAHTIVLPDTITTLGGSSFQDNYNLKDIHFREPETGLNQTQEQAIVGGLVPTGIVHLPETLTSIGAMAFDGATKISELHIPDSVIDVGMSVFVGWNIPQEIYIGFIDESFLPVGWHSMWKSGIANLSIINYATPQTFTITYNLYGGVHSGNPDTYTPKDSLIVLNDATRTGYIFGGWFTALMGGTQVYSIATGTTGNIDLHARWTAITYTITYNSNKPSNASGTITGATGTRTYTFDVPDSLEPSGFNLIGWTANGWNTQANGSGTSYTDGFSPVLNWANTQSANITLYQQWVAKTYTVTYHENRPATASGAVTGTTAVSTHTYDTASALRANGFALAGWTFMGWTDGSGNSYAPGQMISTLSDGGAIALFAQWTENSYTIAYNSNKPSTATGTMSGTMGTSSHVYDIASPLLANGFSLTGWTFIGWKDAAGNDYLPGQLVSTVATSGTGTLFAQWTQNPYTVTYNSNKPSNASGTVTGTMDSSSHLYDVASTLRNNAFVLPGWTFAGWATSANGSVVYANQAAVSTLATGGSVTLFARWTQNAYTITYDTNRPSKASSLVAGSTPNSSHTYDVSSALTSNGYTLTGWTFAGWSTTATGSVVYANNASVSTFVTSGTGTLFAQWTQNTYTVVYDANRPSGASNQVAGTMANSTFIYDEVHNLRNNVFTLTGWTFAGWNTAANGSGTGYTNAEEVTNLRTTGSITLFAQWVRNQYTITYHGNRPGNASNSVTGNTEASVFNYDEASNLRANGFALVGWTFAGWATSANGAVVYSNQASVTNIIGTPNLFARWTQNTYTVVYHANRPSNASSTVGGTMANSVYTYDAATSNLRNNAFALTGWNFAGWATSSTGAVVHGNQAAVLNWSPDNGAVINLYARWTARTFTVTLDRQGGAGGTASVTATFDSAMPSATGPNVRTGYSFNGYWTGTGGTGTQYYTNSMASARTWNIANTTTLYAHWINNTYQVTYGANGGSGSMLNSQHQYDIASNLRANSFTRTGYTFQGWNTQANGSGTARANEASHGNLTSSGTVTLFAQWSPITFTIDVMYYFEDFNNPGLYFGLMQSVYNIFTGTYDVSRTVTMNETAGDGNYHFNNKIALLTQEDYMNMVTYANPFLGNLNIVSTARTFTILNPTTVQGHRVMYAAFYKWVQPPGGGSCVAEGTMITLADGSQKAVETLKGNESLLVWNFHTGTYDAANIVFIESSEKKLLEVVHLFFADGTDIKIIGHHAYWSFCQNRYVNFTEENAHRFIGQFFKKQTGDMQGFERVELIDVQVYFEMTSAWSPVTVGHLNFYTNGMLSMPGATAPFMNVFEVDADTMSFDQVQMLADIAFYGVFCYSELAHLGPVEFFNALQLQNLKIAIGKGMMTWEDLVALGERFAEFM